VIPKVSVIIPTYNRSELLLRAIESARAQTVGEIEILVCDDGSTDDSRKRVENLGDTRIQWIQGKHSGRPAPARNRGISLSRGEWLAFLDSDDIWFPKKIENQLNILEKTGLQASATNALRLGPSGNCEGSYQRFSDPTINLRKILRSNWVICSSALINRSLVSRVNGFPEDQAFKGIEDYALWIRVASLTDFAYDAEPCLYYLDDASNSIRGSLPPQEAFRVEIEQRKRVIRDFLRWSSGDPSGKILDRILGNTFLLREKFKSLVLG